MNLPSSKPVVSNKALNTHNVCNHRSPLPAPACPSTYPIVKPAPTRRARSRTQPLTLYNCLDIILHNFERMLLNKHHAPVLLTSRFLMDDRPTQRLWTTDSAPLGDRPTSDRPYQRPSGFRTANGTSNPPISAPEGLFISE